MKNSALKQRHNLAYGAGHGLKVPSSHSPFPSPARAEGGKARRRRGKGFRTQGLEAVKKSQPNVSDGLARLCRLLCGKPPAFRQAAEPKDFIIPLFGRADAERLSLSAQQAAEPRFFHTFWRPGLRSCAPNELLTRSGSQTGTLSTNLRFTLLALFALLISLASCTKSQKPATEIPKAGCHRSDTKDLCFPADAGKALLEAAVER